MTVRVSSGCFVVAMVLVAVVVVAVRSRSRASVEAGGAHTAHRADDAALAPSRSHRPDARSVPPPRSVPRSAPDAHVTTPSAAAPAASLGATPTREQLDRIRDRIEENEALLDAAYDAALQRLGLSNDEIEEARRIDAEAADQIAELEARAAAGQLVDETEIEESVRAVLTERERRLRALLGEERSRHLAREVGQFVYEARSKNPPSR
jgi:hypothetical protein